LAFINFVAATTILVICTIYVNFFVLISVLKDLTDHSVGGGTSFSQLQES